MKSRENSPAARSRRHVWIGVLEVTGRQDSDVLEATEGAAFNALVLAEDLDDFTRRVRHALAKLVVDLVVLEDVGRFPEDFCVPKKNLESLTAAANEAMRTEEVQFTTWHVFDLDGPDPEDHRRESVS